MKKLVKVIGIAFLVIILVGMAIYMVKSISKKITLEPGWQKIEQVTGTIPKGSVIVVSVNSNLVLLGDDNIKQQSGFVKEGVVVFYEANYCVTQGPVWVFYPSEYEFLLKAENLSLQCNEKLSELKGKQSNADSIYFIGHP